MPQKPGEAIELAHGDIVEISGIRFKLMKKRGKKPWLKRIWRVVE